MQKKILLLDNFDSFTYNLSDYLERTGAVCTIFRNDVSLDKIIENQYDGVVLSPGPETPTKAGNLIKVLDYYHNRLPILGICLGHQAIGEYFGWKLEKAQKPMHGKISSISIFKKDLIFNNLPNKFNVVRYHSLILNPNNDTLEILACTQANEMMALRHKFLPIRGLQFHPEAVLTDFGEEMLANWVKSL